MESSPVSVGNNTEMNAVENGEREAFLDAPAESVTIDMTPLNHRELRTASSKVQLMESFGT